MATLELRRALTRPDADTLVRQIDAYAASFASGAGEWQVEHADDFSDVVDSSSDPEKALAYVLIGASRTDNPDFLLFLGCARWKRRSTAPQPTF